MIQGRNSVQLIIGLGKTGLSCAEYLNDRAIPFKAMDTRDSAPFAEQIEKMENCRMVQCGDPELHLDAMKQYLEDVEQIIISPGVAMTGAFFDMVLQLKLNIVGDIELFAQQVDTPVVAITGSNGKSTVTQLTGELLAASGKEVLIGGNIGTPALDLLKQPAPDFYVLELSSFQLEATRSLRPVAGTVLNISADHMDRYDSIEHYASVKLNLLASCQNVVLSKDEFPESVSEIQGISGKEISISLSTSDDAPSDYHRQQKADGSTWISKSVGTESIPLLRQEELKIAGLHNVSNAMVAIALCDAVGVDINSGMLDKLKQWPGLKHRCQYVGEKQGVRCYNDSKATNVGATIAALEGLSETIPGKLVLIAGGDGKGADFSQLSEIFKRYLKALVLIGKDAERLLAEAGNGLHSIIVGDMKQAVASAFSFAESGDAILLSPACASFDMYKNFEQRGDFFKQEVEAVL